MTAKIRRSRARVWGRKKSQLAKASLSLLRTASPLLLKPSRRGRNESTNRRKLMRTLTDREKRTVRFGVIALAVYLALFLGFRIFKALEARRSGYQQLVTEAQRLRRELQPYENRAVLAQKLRDTFHIDPRNLSRASLVAEASAAIQKA